MQPKHDLAVVICHGSYHTPAPYMPLVDALTNAGIEAYCPQLPTSDLNLLNIGDVKTPDFDRGPPAGGYPQGEEDVKIILDTVGPLVNVKGKKVVLIGHSSGGWTATEAAVPALQAKARQDKGLAGGIIGIFFLGAFIIPVGESINSFFQPKDGPSFTPPFMEFHKHGNAGLGTMVNAETFLFNGLEPAAAKKWSSGLTASPILTTKLSNDAYSTLPCGYLLLENDLTLPKEYQEGMVAAQNQKSGNFTVYRSPAGHSPHLTWINGVVETLEDFVNNIS